MMRNSLERMTFVATRFDFPDLGEADAQADEDSDPTVGILQNMEFVFEGKQCEVTSALIMQTLKIARPWENLTETQKRRVQDNAPTYWRQQYERWLVGQGDKQKFRATVWDNTIVNAIDEIYVRRFQDTKAIDHFGMVEDKEWRNAMAGYKDEVSRYLKAQWSLRLQALEGEGLNLESDESSLAEMHTLMYAYQKWEWMMKATQGKLYYDIPLPTRRFQTDLIRIFDALTLGMQWVSTCVFMVWYCDATAEHRA